MLHANTGSPDVFWRKQWPKRRDYLKLCHKSLTFSKKTRLKSQTDGVIQLNCGRLRTYASCETTRNIRELLLQRSIKNEKKNQKSYTYKTYVLHKTSCAWDQNLGINGIEALTGDWEELNKEIYVCNVCLQSNIKVYCYTQI